MNFSSENNTSQEYVRSLFYKVGSYHNASTEKITSKKILHKWYFDLYETMYANNIKIGSNYFLSIFLQYIKNENTLLHQELQVLSSHEYAESMNFFIDTQVSIRYFDCLLDHNYNTVAIKEEIDGLKHDIDLNNTLSIPAVKEERMIHYEAIKLLESYLYDAENGYEDYLPIGQYIDYLDLIEVKDYILSLPLDDEQMELCISEQDVKRVKKKILTNIDRFIDAFQLYQSKRSRSIKHIKENSFTHELFLEAIKKGFTVEFFFNCFANELSRSKLKTRAFSDKPKYGRIKEFARLYYELTKGKKSSLSYIPPMIFGLDAGLNVNTIYKLTSHFYSYASYSELNRSEFNNNLELFSSKATNRQQLDDKIDTFDFQENQYVAALLDEDDTDKIYKEFRSFLIYYIISNNIDINSNNIFLDDKVISIKNKYIDEIMYKFQKEESHDVYDEVDELHQIFDVVLTEEQIDRIKKL